MGKGNRNRALRELDSELSFEQWPPWLKKLVNDHARRMTREMVDKYEDRADACTLWALHTGFGWGRDRLRRFYETYLRLHRELMERYELGREGDFYCIERLKKLGVDIEAWNAETRKQEESK